LKGIQSYISGLLRDSDSSRQALIGQLSLRRSARFERRLFDDLRAKMNAVTPAQIQGMTTKYIKPESMTISGCRDKSKITEQLKDYEPK